MSWFTELAGKAETLLNNLDEQTGAVLRNKNGLKQNRHDTIVNGDHEGQKKRLSLRNIKKNASQMETSKFSSPSRNSPAKLFPPKSPTRQKLNNNSVQDIGKKSPIKKYPHIPSNHKTSSGDCNGNNVDQFGLRRRRFSLPSDLEMINTEKFTYNMQNLEVENTLLKNELNVMNQEVSELLDRLRKTEDELKSVQIKYENNEKLRKNMKEENESLLAQLNDRERKSESNSNVHLLELKNSELEEKVNLLTEELSSKELSQNKLENDLRHAQNKISEQQTLLEKMNSECHRLEKDWEAYKLRVKNMLYAKDSEIKSLREGSNLSEDTKLLMEQIDKLKEEKEELSQSISSIRQEYLDLKQDVTQVEQRHNAAERFVTALRQTLNEERSARNKAENQYHVINKELQTLRMVSAETISSLRTALQSKEDELNNLKELTTDTSALNVAEYDEPSESDKIDQLSELLIEKQRKIDSLIAEKNVLRIQFNKLEAKYKTDIASTNLRTDSVVHVQDISPRVRNYTSRTFSPFSLLNFKFGRFPMLRVFLFAYMISLHICVIAVLYSRMPDDYTPRPTKS